MMSYVRLVHSKRVHNDSESTVQLGEHLNVSIGRRSSVMGVSSNKLLLIDS